MPIKGLIHDAGVVGQSANDIVIDLHVIPQTPGREIIQHSLQFLRGFAGINEVPDLLQRETQRLKFFITLLRRRALDFIHRLIKIILLGVINAASREEILPRIPTTEADHKIVSRQFKTAQHINEQRDQFRICRRIIFTEDIGIELKVLTQPAFLLTLITEQLRDRIPFNGLLVVALAGGNHACHRGGHLRSH